MAMVRCDIRTLQAKDVKSIKFYIYVLLNLSNLLNYEAYVSEVGNLLFDELFFISFRDGALIHSLRPHSLMVLDRLLFYHVFAREKNVSIVPSDAQFIIATRRCVYISL